jgi:hypothetical protein
MPLAAKLEKFDHPIVFALSITLVVVGMITFLSWGASALGWNGPLQVLKGGVVQSSTQMGPAPQ